MCRTCVWDAYGAPWVGAAREAGGWGFRPLPLSRSDHVYGAHQNIYACTHLIYCNVIGESFVRGYMGWDMLEEKQKQSKQS